MAKLSKLHPLKLAPGSENRCVGTSTALACDIIAICIHYPNQWHAIIDHIDNPLTNKNLAIKIQLYVETLGLQYFTFQQYNKQYRVRCDIFED
jgi:hypothetical protein